MPKKFILAAAAISVFLAWGVASTWAGAVPALKVGDEAPPFQLPSSQDKLVDYFKDYYGKYHLIITFYPAAFTPV